jgi:barstar (barnase inhibitor)
MYSLARFLASAPAGLYRWIGAGARADIAALCRLRRIELTRVRGARLRDKRHFLAAVARAMGLPRWFGMNWDALADALTDFDWQPGTVHVLFCSNLDAFAQRSPIDFATALAVLEDAACFWAERDVHFLVLVECDKLPQFAHLLTVGAA